MMPVILDTGPLAAYVSLRDKRFAEAQALVESALTGEHGQALTTDFVLDEGLTLLQARLGRADVAEAFLELFDRPAKRGILPVLQTTPDVLDDAIGIHLKHYERRLSLTDCTLIAHARAVGARVATFDAAFEGLVDVVR